MKYEDVLTLKAPAPDLKEIRRYAACPSGADEIICSLLTETNEFAYRVRYKILDIHADGDRLDLGFATVFSKDLAKNLAGCSKIVLFAATLGAAADRLLAKYSRISPAKALFVQAICTERIEALCNSFCDLVQSQFAKEGYSARPRFSAGYGDLPLSLQKDIFAALDCGKQIGVTLNDSLLMIPTKSVTAVIGLMPNIQKEIV